MKRRVIMVAVIVVLFVGAAVYGYVEITNQTNACVPLGGAKEVRSTLTHTNITAITEWQLPEPLRYANAVTTAPDGSVWFGEEAVPGVAHLFPSNGTLVEYAWPGTVGTLQGSCPFKASIWGIALWKGLVWATDGDGNAIVGLNPVNDSFVVLTLPRPNSSPYTLTVGPDGALWFTALTQTAFIGRVSPSLNVSMYPVLSHTAEVPSEFDFVNSSFSYYSALDPYEPNMSGVYSFDPQDVAGGILPTRVGGNVTLYEMTSVSASQDTVWVVQHYTSDLWGYDLESHEWTVYPTSTENYTGVTLPYFVSASGGVVWFNEHYGNKIAELKPAPVGTLTEYSEVDPPVNNGTQIQNDLTIATAPDGLWFTSTTGNYLGFANGSYVPSFAIAVQESNTLTLVRGEGVSLTLSVSGTWTQPLKVQFSDSENLTSVPQEMSIVPDLGTLPQGQHSFQVNISTGLTMEPGSYVVGVTVTDGLVYRTAYVFVTVV